MSGSSDGTITAHELSGDAQRQLSEVGVADPEASARHIVEYAAGIRWSMAEWRTAPLTTRVVATVDRLLERRAVGEPLQYVLGEWSFRSIELAVDRRALIPRPETEVVVGFGLEALGESEVKHPLVVDLGTGSGAIALAIAAEASSARVIGVERSGDALALARSNLAGLGMAGSRVELVEGSWFEPLDHGLAGQVDLVIANPPYVASGERLDPSVAEWEPTEALYAGPTGLDDIVTIVGEARRWLRPGGSLVVEIGAGQGPDVERIAVEFGYRRPRIRRDLTGNDRALVATWDGDLPTAAELERLEQLLQGSAALVVPTDTVAGVVARALDPDAVRGVCDLKQRPYTEPLPVFVADVAQASTVAVVPDELSEALRELWPGALTVVCDRIDGTDPVAGTDTVALRCPDSPLLRALAARVGPLTGTSANLHGEPTPADAGDAGRALGVPADRVVAGASGGDVASTIVRIDVVDSGFEVTEFRAGPISVAEVDSVLTRASERV